MNNEKITNEEVKVEKNKDMNDRDFLNDLLQTEKNISVNMTIALNEASNEKLYDELFTIFKDIKQSSRNLYECMFKNGWYQIEKASDDKINQTKNELKQKYDELQA